MLMVVKKIKKSYKLNFKIPSYLCRVSKKNKIPFVHISTDMHFNVITKGNYNEKSKYTPINQYSLTKVKAEKYILKYKKSLIVRSNFFGFGEKNNQTISDKIIFEQKFKKKTYLWDDVYFTPMYIPNLIFFINLLIENGSRGVFNVSSEPQISKYKFGIKLIRNILKIIKFIQIILHKKIYKRPVICL